MRRLLRRGNDCGSGDFGLYEDPRVPVDRRGRFRYWIRGQSTAITAVRGRLTGWRQGAPLRVWWDGRWVFPSSCLLTYRFEMHPVQRVPVRTGRWAGTDAGGMPVQFFVSEQGRYIEGLRAPGPYPVCCSDRIVRSADAYLQAA